MARKHPHQLGVAITERSVHLAEVRGADAKASAAKASVLEIDGTLMLSDPERFGKRLAEHLAQEGYTAKHASVGLCSRWVMARPMQLPPAEGEALAGMARLKIEREFAGGHGDLVFDYQLAGQRNGQTGLLMVGLPAKRLDQVARAFTAAGLQVQRLGATALDIMHGQPDGLALVFDPAGSTLARNDAGACVGFGSVGVDTSRLDGTTEPAQDLTAAAARLAMTGFAAGADSTRGVALVDAAGLDEPARRSLSAVMQETLGPCDTRSADAALAAARATHRSGSVNLLDSKLTPKPPRRMPVYAGWLIRAAAVLLLVAAVAGYFWYDANHELAQLRDEYDTVRDDAQRLQAIRRDTRAASGWYDDRPAVLDCLLELTRTFPQRGRIWVAGLTLSADASGTVICRAADEQTMWRYVNAMIDSKALTDVALRQHSETGRQGSEVSFDVTFTYRPDGEAL
jgi:hypothetical protein